MSKVRGRIYCITHIASGKQYVGQTRHPIERRWRDHCQNAHRPGHTSYLHRAIAKYGADQFRCKQLTFAFSEACLNRSERFWIAKLGTLVPSGYNLTIGGGNGTHHPLTRAKLSRIKKRAWSSRVFRSKMMEALRIKSAKPEYREKLSKATAAAWNNPHIRLKMSKALKAAYSSSESRLRMAKARKLTWRDPIYRAKMKKISSAPEYRAKMAERSKAMWCSQERRKKFSKAIKAIWLDPKYRAKRAKSMKVTCSNPEFHKNKSNAVKAMWLRSSYRSKIMSIRSSLRYRTRMSSAIKKLWSDSKYRTKQVMARKRPLDT